MPLEKAASAIRKGKPTTARFEGNLSERSIHLCVDMQRLFAPEGPWPTPWMELALPKIINLSARHTKRTVFTRFIPPLDADDLPGQWRRYYDRWRWVTRRRVDPKLLELVPPLQEFSPPAVVIDKPVYSPFLGRKLRLLLGERRADALVISGGESEVCVLATVLGAMDLGYRVIIAGDAICSSSDMGHDAFITIMHTRFSEQIEIATTDEIMDAWDATR